MNSIEVDFENAVSERTISNDLKSQSVVLNETHDLAIRFDDANHKYHLYSPQGESIYTFDISVTSYITLRLFDEFDQLAKSFLISKRNKMVQFKLLASWQMAGKLGTCVHRNIEEWLNENHLNRTIEDRSNPEYKGESIKIYSDELEPHIPDFELQFTLSDYFCREKKQILNNEFIYRVHNMCFQFRKMLDNFLLKKKLIATEYLIYDPAYNGQTQLAGCIDALYWDDEAKREVCIVDWKTNRLMDFAKNYKISNNKSPFFGLEISKLSRYYCQLHCYANILERCYNVKVTSAFIVHFEEGSFNIHSATDHRTCVCKSSKNAGM